MMPFPYTFPIVWTDRFIVEVDWDNDGQFEIGEDVSADIQRVSWHRGRNAELARMTPGEAEVTLKNDDGTYSPENSGSPLSGNLLEGRTLRIRSTDPVVKTHFVGKIEEIIVNPDPEEQTGYIRAVERSAQALSQKTIRTQLQANRAAGTAVADILDEAGWPAGDRSLDAGQTTFGYFWVHDEEALSAIRKVEEAERGLFYVNGAGNAVYEDRHHRLKSDHLVSQSTITGTMVGLGYQRRLREIRNEVTIKVYAPVEGSAEELWRLREFPALPTATRSILVQGETSPIDATAVYYADYDDPSTVITPVSSTDYTANSLADGLGDDLTSQLTVALETSFAMGAAVSVTNNGPLPCFLTLLKLRGTPLERPDAVTISQGDATSQTDFGRRTLPIDNELMQNVLEAQDIADWLVGLLKDGQAYIEIEIVNASSALLQAILNRDISDRATIAEANTGLSDDYFIERLSITVEGEIVTARWLCSKADPKSYLILDDATYGTLDDGNRLAA